MQRELVGAVTELTPHLAISKVVLELVPAVVGLEAPVIPTQMVAVEAVLVAPVTVAHVVLVLEWARTAAVLVITLVVLLA